MKRLGLVVLLASAIGAAPVAAQVAPAGWSTWTQLFVFSDCGGGGQFATCMAVDLRYYGTTIGARVLNDGGPGNFTRVGVVNLGTGPNAMTFGAGTASTPNGAAWLPESNQGLSGAGLPKHIWAWNTPQGNSGVDALQPGEFGFFTFVLTSAAATFDPNRLGIAVHSQGFNSCSTKYGVWRNSQGQVVTNDNPAGYDPTCVNVPEPESMALLMTGLAGLAFVAVRRRTALVDENGDDVVI